MKKWIWMMTVLTAIVVLAACGNQGKTEGTKEETVTVKDMLNKDGVKIKKNPKKVVVFDMGSLDTLDKLGVNVTALPKQVVPKYLSKYEDDKYENVGGLKEPNFEKIAEIKPDLIIIQSRQSDAFDEFSEIAPTILMDVDTANYMESFKKNATTLGEIFDKEDEVKKELAAIDQKVDALKKQTKELKQNGLVIMANDSKMTAFGAKSRYGLIHDVFGITPADQKLEPSDKHGQSISYEYMVKTNPDYLFVIDRGAAIGEETSAKQLVENDYVKSVKAVKNNHVVYLNSDMWYLSGGGLKSLTAMIDEVKQGIDQK
ncbi:siderophore ABC transporter substrate-binding protein [Bacillus sp. FSL M8-0266]|uniref:siderophore ABC transporter substrate-binding protein n=1 Tax=Bacillus TaxID=1386 RepID=UPI0007EEEE0C|nr:siderophore ABC transporter substrate-binding protein [Bacillus pumilus]MBU8575156.1 siderophore ABC transporter substrate-binding protein [Bacillus pumilus]MCY7574670.1 siderophore ABC transporter substrate-binding protein [Bacillus pumilus]OBS84407.1 ABC transporter [Bacillus pumilus]PRS66391.1 ABC transporter [Bacillus pumilus]WFO48567.1 siderophore ABC transporter substrate-binding protein [Bacillus pumilus]